MNITMNIRKLLACLLALAAVFWLQGANAQRVYAAEYAVIDNYGLFTSDEIQRMEEMARKIADEYGINVLFVTDANYGFSDNYARDLIEDTGTGTFPDGYLAFCINMADRSYWVDAYGEDVRAIFTQDVTDSLSEDAYDRLTEGEYGQAAIDVLKNADRVIQVKTDPMGWLKKPLIYWERTAIFSAIALAGSLLGAWGLTYAKLRGHHDKNLAYDASGYGSELNLQLNRNQFVSHYQTRIRKPKQNTSSGGFSGGGGSSGHTGSGGHF